MLKLYIGAITGLDCFLKENTLVASDKGSLLYYQLNMSDKKFPEGFYWGEKARGAFASTPGQPLFFLLKNSPSPCQQLCEHLEQSGDKVYSICKIQRP